MSTGAARARRERGAAAVEFALVVPLLFLLVFAIISYGVMLSFRQAVSQAAAEGARAAAVAPATPSAPQYSAVQKGYAAIAAALGSDYSCVAGTLKRSGTPVGSCAVTAPAACTATACPYSVTVVYDYSAHPLVPRFPGVPMPSHLVYTASAQGNA